MVRITEEAGRMGMKINTEKTQVQHIGKDPINIQIHVNGALLEQVDDFTYLGGTVNVSGGIAQDISRRIGLARGVMRSFDKVWRAKELSSKLKVKIYELLVLSVLLYNAETWTLREADNQRLLVFEMSCLRRIAGVSLQ